jgi:hypothetical protein
MSDRKLAKAVQDLFKEILRLQKRITKAFVTWLLRTALVINRRTRQPVAGFVLPTTALLVLVVALTAGALSYRAYSTSTRTINETQSRVIYNAATPAVDRARAKMEFLFDSKLETRYPGGVPSDGKLTSMMLNANPPIVVKGVAADGTLSLTGGGNNGMGNTQDPYTLPDETRMDVNGDNKPDNAWSYRISTKGNPCGPNNPTACDATVVYSIVLTVPPDVTNAQGNVTQYGSDRLIALANDTNPVYRALPANGEIDPTNPQRKISYTRTGPLSNTASASGCATVGGTGSAVEGGWYPDTNNTAQLRKNFQVDALVVPDSVANGNASFSTLEFQQDRILERGNKWGAWFRNDLEIFPGPQFNWNGAMHTEGSLIIGNTSFSAYLISSPGSCLFSPSASEISSTFIPQGTKDSAGNPIPPFNGIIASGRINDNSSGGSSLIYLHSPNPIATKLAMSTANDWNNGAAPYTFSSDPVLIQVKDWRQSRGADPTNAAYYNGPPGVQNQFSNRFPNTPKAESTPYVDDLYRADNRWGPKFKYNDAKSDPTTNNINQIPAGTKSGDPIPSVYTKLVGDVSTTTDGSGVGLDGYWERRARTQGLRILVGQRLELGNTYGWTPPIDRYTGSNTRPTNYLQTTPLTNEGDGILQLRQSIPAPPSTAVPLTTNADQNLPTAATTNAANPDTSDNEGDPLYPSYKPNTSSTAVRNIKHEEIQRRSLRDNIAAAQSTAVYHAAVSMDYPVACLATTAHPGSPYTLRRSINFMPTYFVDNSQPGTGGSPGNFTALLTDFFHGRGTNGWEFEPPRGTQQQYEIDIINPDSPLRIALQNLANFAGDYSTDGSKSGAFPPTQDVAGTTGVTHPYPELTMWGNFSNLRRALQLLNNGGNTTAAYASLSPADKTYLQTAACTLGMLAYNIDRVQRFDPRSLFNDTRTYPGTPAAIVSTLGQDLWSLMDGIVDEANGKFEVLPISQLSTYGYGTQAAGSSPSGAYNPRDYDRVPAEAFLGKLRELYSTQPAASQVGNDAKIRMAELIFTYFQVRRDRTYGFRPSPASNTWNYNPFVVPATPAPNISNGTTLWSSACDPFTFPISAYGATTTGKIAAQNVTTEFISAIPRLGLSRLCGTVIPPGATREAPGDFGLPARNDAATGSNPDTTKTVLDYIPNKAGNPPTGLSWTQSPTDFRTSTPLASGTNTPIADNYNPVRLSSRSIASNATTTLPAVSPTATPPIGVNRLPYMQATVQPKWPSLYFLFPEFSHSSTGGVFDRQGDGIGSNNNDQDWSDDVDHRQPTGLLNVDPGFSAPPPAPPPTPIRNAFQPWAEPYIVDPYNQSLNPPAQANWYRVVDSVTPAAFPYASYDTYLTDTPITLGDGSTFKYLSINPFPDDLSLKGLALNPRIPTGPGVNNPSVLTGNNWQLPALAGTNVPAPPTNIAGTQPEGRAGFMPPNRILIPNGNNFNTTGTIAAVSFLDRVMFNGRESQPVRVLDVDLGMLRRNRPGNQGGVYASAQAYPPGNTAKSDVWLPVSGIVYAFREDAVREDAINRPWNGATGPTTTTLGSPTPQTDARNTQNLTVSSTADNTLDPPLVRAIDGSPEPRISVKPVDNLPDPERRPHGFRLRDGSQLARHSSMSIPAKDNYRGLSFFSDEPVYIMGDFNLHQSGADDTVGTRLEEFLDLLPSTGAYTETQFYGRQANRRNPNFASSQNDRWRPSEILADGISVVSDTICDGSLLDGFMAVSLNSSNNANLTATTYGGYTQTDSGSGFPPAFYPYNALYGTGGSTQIYNNTNAGLYGPGCNSNRTTFLNQNRPRENTRLSAGWAWLRENPWDILSPVRIGRNGDALVLPPPKFVTGVTNDNRPLYPTTTPTTPAASYFTPAPTRAAVPYTSPFIATTGTYYNLSDGRTVPAAADTRVNTIIVSGLVPSSLNLSYGGLHNFPRFLETWTRLWFSGSFLQLNFSNLASAPFSQVNGVWEPNAPTGAETIGYYSPPQRLWGYDVALQFAPAGQAAARFITPGKVRNEFYSELPANDPYIKNLCLSLGTLPNNPIPANRCPS